MLTSLDAEASIIAPKSLSTDPTVKQKLLIVGGGMAAYGLCFRLVEKRSEEHSVNLADPGVDQKIPYQITVFGEEPQLPYDRVNLSELFAGRTQEQLLLADRAWYQTHQIDYRTDCRIERIDRENCQIIDASGQRHSYDQLVLATGSRPFVPPIPGVDSLGVHVYRTLGDLLRIQSHAMSSDARVGMVIGGGLLGLEAAKVLKDLGLKTSVVEMAPGLMPRQLDSQAASRLREHVESIGVDVHLIRRTKRIEPIDGGKLKVHFENADDQTVDLLIVAAGVRPNDMLAKEAGLELGGRGGIAVNSSLQTSDSNVYAIGECAAFDDHLYGLVAPCYRMAETLADRLLGKPTLFEGADESAELKLLGVQVVTLGRAIGESRGGIVLAQEDDQAYRKLILEQGKVVGAACVGPWDELAQIRQAVHKQRMLWPIQRTRFKRTGTPWTPGGAIRVHQWPQDAVVCSCLGVTRGQISSALDQGARSVDQVARVTKASTACGSCQALLCELAGDGGQTGVPSRDKVMLAASLIAAGLILSLMWLPPVEFAVSVQDSWRKIDWLWRDHSARQWTGFTTLGLTILGLLFSLRKRVPRFSLGSYAFWRGVHGVLGAAVLLAVAVHTGLRLGENLNFLLGIVFLAVAAVGSIAGIFSSLEAQATGAQAMFLRRWRPRLATLHTLLFWPLPALVAVHIFSFYWFRD